MATLARLRQALFAPVDGAGLVWFRVVFGAVMVWEMCRYLAYDWIGEHYAEPDFNFTYYPFDFVAPLPGVGAYLHAVVLLVLAAMIAVGLLYRYATVLFFVGFTWFFLCEQAKYLNHLYLVCLLAFLLCFLPANRLLAVDARRHPETRSDHVPAWSLWLLRFQLGLVYFHGGLAKLNGDWLQGQPMRIWLGQRADYPVVGGLYGHDLAPWFFSYAGLAFDLLIPWLLLWRRTRVAALVAVATFHLSNEIMFSIGIFPYLMLAATLVFCEPSWPRRVFPVLFGGQVAGPTPASSLPSPGRQRLVLGLLGAWACWQCLFPFRHLLYPGNVSWTEEGHLYAWHMKLRDKSGRARFTVQDKLTGEEWKVDPADLLTERQLRKLKTRPDLVHQLALHIAQEAAEEGHPEVAVYADVWCSLNGRKAQRMIDPEVDLAAEPRTPWPKPWILPLTEPLPEGRWAWADRMERPRAPDAGQLPAPGATRGAP